VIDWSKYKLRDLPIVSKFPRVDVHSGDERVNGRLFCEQVARKCLDEIHAYVLQDSSPILLTSKEVVLGTGKSAILAAEYWRLREADETCLWTQVTGLSPMRTILLKVAYEMVRSRAIAQIKNKLTSVGGISEGLRKMPNISPSHPLIPWLRTVLSSEFEDFPIALADVKRKTRAFSVSEAFSFVLSVYQALVKKKMHIFLDQLEIYVRYNTARQISAELNELIRGTSENALLLATMHNDALVKLENDCGEDVRTFLSNAPKVEVPEYSADDLVKIGLYLISKHRIGRAGNLDSFYPFDEKAMKYIARKSGNNIRKFLVRIRAALMFGALSDYPTIDRKLLSSETAKARILVEVPISE